MAQSLIKLSDIQYNVVNVQVKTSRGYNAYRPNTTPKCQEIILTLSLTGEDAQTFYKWYLNNEVKDLDLYVNVVKLIPFECMRHFHLANTYCFSIEEVFDNALKKRSLLRLGITSGTLSLEKTNKTSLEIKSF